MNNQCISIIMLKAQTSAPSAVNKGKHLHCSFVHVCAHKRIPTMFLFLREAFKTRRSILCSDCMTEYGLL